jgi:virginiamycin B lyase
MKETSVRTKFFILTTALSLGSAISLSAQKALPEGNGRDLVQSACVGCHALGNIINSSGYNAQGWETVVNKMVEYGAKVTPDQRPTLLAYLTTTFPRLPKPPAVIIPGSEKVSFQEWDLKKGVFPHDPLGGPDGSIWYTGYRGNLLGRIDPATGANRDYPLNTPNSTPHGLIWDKAGYIWFTALEGNYIGKLNVETGKITDYKLPAGATGPNTLLFDKDGNIWFSLYTSSRMGWLNTKTGEIKIAVTPTSNSQPYGMGITSKGVPIFAEYGTNKLASIDPNTMEIHEWTLPDPDTRIRRLLVMPDDTVYYDDYDRGYIAHFDPKLGKVTGEWASPGGPRSQPYAMARVGDAIWYVESNTAPNALVRFDLKTQKFQTWGIPGGGSVVRNMMVTRDGNHLLIPESGVDKIGLVTLGQKGSGSD